MLLSNGADVRKRIVGIACVLIFWNPEVAKVSWFWCAVVGGNGVRTIPAHAGAAQVFPCLVLRKFLESCSNSMLQWKILCTEMHDSHLWSCFVPGKRNAFQRRLFSWRTQGWQLHELFAKSCDAAAVLSLGGAEFDSQDRLVLWC